MSHGACAPAGSRRRIWQASGIALMTVMLVSCTADDRSSDPPTAVITASSTGATTAPGTVSTTRSADPTSASTVPSSIASHTESAHSTAGSTSMVTRDPQPNELRMIRMLERAGATDIGIAQFGFEDAQMVATWKGTDLYVIVYPLKTESAVKVVQQTTIGGHQAWTARSVGFGSGIYFECADFSYQLYLGDVAERSATPTELDALVKFAEALMPLAGCR